MYEHKESVFLSEINKQVIGSEDGWFQEGNFTYFFSFRNFQEVVSWAWKFSQESEMHLFQSALT